MGDDHQAGDLDRFAEWHKAAGALATTAGEVIHGAADAYVTLGKVQTVLRAATDASTGKSDRAEVNEALLHLDNFFAGSTVVLDDVVAAIERNAPLHPSGTSGY